MKKPEKLKFTIIGAGSVCFCPATLKDILLNENICSVPLTISLMDIAEDALKVSENFARKAIEMLHRDVTLQVTTNLEDALQDSDFVITAIEVDRYYYWSMDFHIPRRYGFRQVYGENGGPGGMFHTLRNLPPMMHIAESIARICPNAWLLNYTNPEAKLVDAISRLTNIKVVGLCHGEGMGMEQLSEILDIPQEEIDADVAGLNHFGWFTRIQRRSTGEDLYPLLREREAKIPWLSHWDELGLTRLMMHTYGLYPYPGTNHIGEYIAWSDEMLASTKIQYFYDPVENDPWSKNGTVPEFVYSFRDNPTDRPMFENEPSKNSGDPDPDFRARFNLGEGDMKPSNEYGIRIAESIAFDIPRHIGAVNVPNKGFIPNLPKDMVVEIPADVDGQGIHPQQCPELPTAIASMIETQGSIHKLLIEAYTQKSRKKLLQALLLDPTISNYNNAVALINEMCERQKELLPPMEW